MLQNFVHYTSSQSIRVSLNIKEVRHLEQNTCTENKIISVNDNYSPHSIFKRWKMFSQAGNKLPCSTAFHIGDDWPQFSVVQVTLTSFASLHSRLIKAMTNPLPGALA